MKNINKLTNGLDSDNSIFKSQLKNLDNILHEKYDNSTKEIADLFRRADAIIHSQHPDLSPEDGDEEDQSIYEYVDLNLPSGTLWAKCNVGAQSESDYGLYFAWGEIIGYPDERSGKEFAWEDYKFGEYDSDDHVNQGMTKYNSTDNKLVLDLEDDAAYVNQENEQHIPTDEQMEELIDNTMIVDAIVNGVTGKKFISKTDNSKYIFLPSTGELDEGSQYHVGEEGYYWSQSRSETIRGGKYLYFKNNNNSVSVSNINRYRGYNIRGVKNITQQNAS